MNSDPLAESKPMIGNGNAARMLISASNTHFSALFASQRETLPPYALRCSLPSAIDGFDHQVVKKRGAGSGPIQSEFYAQLRLQRGGGRTETIESMPTRLDQQHFAQALVEQARSEGVELIGPGGLLTGLTKTVLETALEAEITDHSHSTSVSVLPGQNAAGPNGCRPAVPGDPRMVQTHRQQR